MFLYMGRAEKQSIEEAASVVNCHIRPIGNLCCLFGSEMNTGRSCVPSLVSC